MSGASLYDYSGSFSDHRNPLYSWPSPRSLPSPVSPTVIEELAMKILEQRSPGVIEEQAMKILEQRQQLKYEEELKELQEFLQNYKESKKRKRSETFIFGEERKKVKTMPLSINTNVPRVKGPRAPTRTTFPAVNRSNVSTANILSGSRRRR